MDRYSLFYFMRAFKPVGPPGLHRLPVQPRAAILLISSIDRDGPPFLFRKPKASEISPVGRAALISIRPPASLSTAIFSPGRTPRCFRRSLRRVTCPFAVIVRGLMDSLVVNKVLILSLRAQRSNPWRKTVQHDCFVALLLAMTRSAALLTKPAVFKPHQE